ncbi:hypothetical protein L2E82_18666 [Cichorium intybus]|uniref:Uncharacterized protein n=1 Tax=Cichorium intybus TaxID=13427 RepID=A0ACB9FC29_CICIN|nr:hypothetical protein L2E82_18666 [Cichorium intybus]
MATAIHITCTATIEGRLSNVSDSTSTSSVSDQEECIKSNSTCVRRSRKWRKLMKKVVDGSKKSIYGSSKPLKFRYDAFLDYAAMTDRLPQPALLTISLRTTQLPHRKRPQTFEDEEVTTPRSLRKP